MSDEIRKRNIKISNTKSKINSDDTVSPYIRIIMNWMIDENEQRKRKEIELQLKITNIEELLKEKGFHEGI